MGKILILLISLIFSNITLYSQNKTLKGRVISDQFDALPRVSITINDTTKVGETDLNGCFQIDIPISVNKLSFSTVGTELASIELTDRCNEIDIAMMLSCTCDFMTPKKVDKYRMKKFNKLPELHKEGFKKGIFKTEYACYTRYFKPNLYKNKN
ncbi:carboxypeptidase-like regulatory domain-containing protein [Hymenobacter tibetensis]|uniref:Carboxypeptidase-like regulatory domain-containing protein n=1 Tax=Hymenobacter tibetensis TaxID=497967 RepID=A0ABY4CUF2_9BACT|nr:carboxypeptidase-like regulatory domain-containing protein [Hymenobacter tibetensis]UOG73059.1 carboxypeptidase-like regulatory domain-containing protein [Hymenobacter tibetensis]